LGDGFTTNFGSLLFVKCNFQILFVLSDMPKYFTLLVSGCENKGYWFLGACVLLGSLVLQMVKQLIVIL